MKVGRKETNNTSVSYRICIRGAIWICKFLKGVGTKSHLFIRCVSGFSRGALEGAGEGKCTPYHPLYETLINYSRTSLIRTPGEQQNLFVLTGVICIEKVFEGD